jgi:hypothetical protein
MFCAVAQALEISICLKNECVALRTSCVSNARFVAPAQLKKLEEYTGDKALLSKADQFVWTVCG